MDPIAFIPAVILMWLVLVASRSFRSGWIELAKRFGSDKGVEGEEFQFCSASIGEGLFFVDYRYCLFVTVGRPELEIAIMIPFQFLHPALVIPWTSINGCECANLHTANDVYVTVVDSNKHLLFRGAVGQSILKRWNELHAT